MDYAKQYQEYLARANQALEKACETFLPEESEVCRAARYSLLGGGKRIRAVLVLAVCDMLNGSAEAAEQFAAAVEMLHCYSLIHDDLPCMDNDDLRRGRPSCHKAFGERSRHTDWLHNGDVCRLLNISKRTLQHYRDTGVLPFAQIGHKCYYKREDVEQLLQTKTEKAETGKTKINK